MTPQKDTSRRKNQHQTELQLFAEEKNAVQLAALSELGGPAQPTLPIEDRSKTIGRILQEQSQKLDEQSLGPAVRSVGGTTFPTYFAREREIIQPKHPALVRGIADASYYQYPIAGYRFQENKRENYLTEIAALREKTDRVAERILWDLRRVLETAVEASCIWMATERNAVSKPSTSEHVRNLFAKLEFPQRISDIPDGDKPLEDPMRHDKLREFLRSRPYRELGGLVRDYYWRLSVNMALAFHRSLTRGVDHNTFGIAAFDKGTRTARFHYFEQSTTTGNAWDCVRHDHELFNARQFAYSKADEHHCSIPSFIEAVVEATPWLERLFSIIDGELIFRNEEQVSSVQYRREPVRRPVTYGYDPALVLGGEFVLAGWDGNSSPETERLLAPRRKKSKPIDAVKRCLLQVSAALVFVVLSSAVVLGVGEIALTIWSQSPERIQSLIGSGQLWIGYFSFLLLAPSAGLLRWTLRTTSYSNESRIARLFAAIGIRGDDE